MDGWINRNIGTLGQHKEAITTHRFNPYASASEIIFPNLAKQRIPNAYMATSKQAPWSSTSLTARDGSMSGTASRKLVSNKQLRRKYTPNEKAGPRSRWVASMETQLIRSSSKSAHRMGDDS